MFEFASLEAWRSQEARRYKEIGKGNRTRVREKETREIENKWVYESRYPPFFYKFNRKEYNHKQRQLNIAQ